MDDSYNSKERATQLNALKIQMMFKVKGVKWEECYRTAKEYLSEGKINNRQFNWLAGQGCLGPELLDKAKKMFATTAINQLKLLPKQDGEN